ncbi:hypothetical protein ES332_D11G249500v1 [Gossypium tomentosum]|uniref:Uncharacterized protein n=1 Tax=Gossypium tomentosum TaxID=34277 RepID=A0A5D2ITJ6_GOSTO|nr:hypothetical protein ES332_D11G249500v1 [Gossypium tomentosum]
MKTPQLQLLENLAIENVNKYCCVGETAWIFVQPTTFKVPLKLSLPGRLGSTYPCKQFYTGSTQYHHIRATI